MQFQHHKEPLAARFQSFLRLNFLLTNSNAGNGQITRDDAILHKAYATGVHNE